MNEERLLGAASMLEAGLSQAGQAYAVILSEITAARREVMKEGGIHSVEDLLGHFSADRLRHDVIALLSAVGLNDVLIQAAGRRWDPQRDFLARYEGLVASGVLTASRGKPNTDPLSAYAHPGVKIVSPGPQATSPQGKSI